MDKNIWKSDNDNGYKYQFMAVANAIKAVHDNKLKGNLESIRLKGISWVIVEEYLEKNDLHFDCDQVYDVTYDCGDILAIDIPVFDNTDSIYVNIYLELLTGYLHIY
jgi:hypothetical protein